MTTSFSIIMIVFDHLGVPIESRQDRCRKHELVEARQLSMYYIDKYSKQTLARIGEYFNLDHATVLHSIRTVNNYLETDRRYKEKIQKIDSKILANIQVDDYKYVNYDTDRV